MSKKPKSWIDCAAMKRAIQSEIAAEIAGMTHAQELAYYRAKAATGPLAGVLRAARCDAPVAMSAAGTPAKRPRSETLRRRKK